LRRPAQLSNLLSFGVQNSQIQSKPIILNEQNDSQDEKPFVGGTISVVTVKKFIYATFYKAIEKNTYHEK
jgi:hypothetical protein